MGEIVADSFGFQRGTYDPAGGGWYVSAQTVDGSFSAVSKPILASRFSLFSMFRDLHLSLIHI